MEEETITKTFECPDSAYLTISNIRGEVNIEPGEDNVIAISAQKSMSSGDTENTIIEISQDSDGKVAVRTRYDKSGLRIFGKFVPCKVKYDVRVPRNCSLKVRGVSNAARIEGISGDLDISTVSGDLDCRSLSGELRIKTVSGDVQGEGISAAARLEAVSGDIHLKKSDIPELRGKTDSGDIMLDTPLGEGPYEFNSVSGDIKLEINPLSGASVSSSSISGDIRTSLPVSWTDHSRNHHSMTILNGGVEIHHNSVSGDLFIASAEEIGAAQDLLDEEFSKNTSLSHTEILESIERGEMSVEEAVGMIDGSNDL